jgi:E3 ubiquitin-protein ligase RBBP6
MSVRFKFKNDLEFATLPCDGFNISVRDLKKSIIRMKKLGRVTDFDLTVTNQQTNESYEDEDELIPKNTTLIVARHPLPSGQKKVWEEETAAVMMLSTTSSATSGNGVASIVSSIGDDGNSEEDKLTKMMSNSTEMYDQKNWISYRGKMAFGGRPPPKMFRCSKCHQSGHWPQDCGLTDLKKTTGIPRSFLKPTTAETPGAKINPQGNFRTTDGRRNLSLFSGSCDEGRARLAWRDTDLI